MKNLLFFICLFISFASISSCKKDKDDCKANKIEPFFQKFNRFECASNNQPYTKIFYDIDSIIGSNDCYFHNGGAVFPLDYDSNIYIVVADTLFNYGDTITGEVFVDTCKKELTYNVKFEKGSGAPFTYLGVNSIFCMIENITTDYKITINKQRNNVP